MGTLWSTQNTFSVLLDSVCAVTAMIKLRQNGHDPKCDKSENATARIPICRLLWLSQFVTIQNTTSQIDVNSARRFTAKYRKHLHIDIWPFQVFLFLWLLQFVMVQNKTYRINANSALRYTP